jgi:uncharacterized protein (DUF58 family)
MIESRKNGFPRRPLFPPTLAGVFVILAGLFLLPRGLSNKDPYEVLLSFAALGTASLLFLVGLRASRRLSGISPGWVPPEALAAGADGPPHVISGLEGRVPYFFRLHYEIQGSLKIGPDRKVWVSGDSRADDMGRCEVLLPFPLSGIFHGRGRCRLRDVFGLYSFSPGEEIHRRIPVLPGPHPEKPLLRIDAFTGSEEKQNRKTADEERYYMREYAPGDRFRDINWKASSRLAVLVTRIAPFTQEKTRTVHVDFRNYGPPGSAGLLELWTLDRMKARLLAFLRTLREEHPEYRFNVRTGSEDREIETLIDLEEFAADLAGLSYSTSAGAPSAAGPGDPFAAGELYIFSSAFDLRLPALLGSRNEEITHLYMTIPLQRDSIKSSKDGPETRKNRTFRMRELFREELLPDPRLLRPRRAPVLPSIPRPARGRVEADYTEVRP